MGRTKRHRTRKADGQVQHIVEDTSDVSQSLMKYMKSKQWKNWNQLRIGTFGTAGRGVYSQHEIQFGDSIIEIPFDCLITLSTLNDDNAFSQLFMTQCSVLQNEIEFQALLATYILYSKHLDGKSSIHSYILSIPTEFTNPYFCSKTELYYLTEQVLELIVEQNKQIKNNYEKLSTTFSNKICDCCSTPISDCWFTLDAFKWAYFAVNSRSIYVEPTVIRHLSNESQFLKIISDEPRLALAPLLDMINHSSSVETEAGLNLTIDEIKKYKSRELNFRLITKNRFKSYEQLFISYGSLDNTKLLVEYGFFVSGNESDRVLFKFKDLEEFRQNDRECKEITIHNNKIKLLREFNFFEEMFVDNQNGLSHNLAIVLYILYIEKSHYLNRLETIAFGITPEFATIAYFAIKLIEFKCKQLQNDKEQLEKLSTITPSGQVYLGYLTESISLLNIVKHNYLH